MESRKIPKNESMTPNRHAATEFNSPLRPRKSWQGPIAAESPLDRRLMPSDRCPIARRPSARRRIAAGFPLDRRRIAVRSPAVRRHAANSQ